MLVKLISLVALFSLINCASHLETSEQSVCSAEIVESIPDGLTFPNYRGPTYNSTISAWLSLVQSAKKSINIASYYWSLLCTDVDHPIKASCEVGESFVKALVGALNRGVIVKIAINGNQTKAEANPDIATLKAAGAMIAGLDFNSLIGYGILHTKFMVVDDAHFYLGSANMDWRSLTQVKELGVHVTDCKRLGADLNKIWTVYWKLGGPGAKIPDQWPSELETDINITSPLEVRFGQSVGKVYLASSPPQFNPKTRTSDLDALLEALNSAKRFVYISVMDFSPKFLYTREKLYWPIIDDALRSAVVDRHIDVRLLAANWSHTKSESVVFLKSLNELANYPGKGKLSVKLFNVPVTSAEQSDVPFSRVNHDKYMVTDEAVYIGTSNWSADYFTNTGGVSFIASFEKQTGVADLRKDVLNIFWRDWESDYSFNVDQYKPAG